MKLPLAVPSPLALLLASTALAAAWAAEPDWGGEIRFAVRSEPRTFHPLKANDESSMPLAYLTAGTLLRINRVTQKVEPALATSWKLAENGRRVDFQLRKGVRFSDGSEFDSADVVRTFRDVLDPALESHFAGSLRVGGQEPRVTAAGPHAVSIRFAAPPSGWELLFDELPILSSRSPLGEKAVLGPFRMEEYRSGASVTLARNPHYWKLSAGGRRLPYADRVRIDIQSNSEIEMVRFRRGELDFINKVSPDQFERLAADNKAAAKNLGPSLETEQLWFNLAPEAPIPAARKAWFASREFRRAISSALRREDIARVAFGGMASAAAGPVPPSNQRWHNGSIGPARFDLPAARKLLTAAGFRWSGSQLRDRAGNPVELSIVTNAGNRARARTASLIQQDLTALGIDARIVPLDFPALVERIVRTRAYDLCLLSMANADPDPNGWSNYYLSSGPNHPWNPAQQSPATPWEAEIDKLMIAQSTASETGKRKKFYDRIQEILALEAPVLYLVHKNVLAAVGPRLRNIQPATLSPYLFWNLDQVGVIAGAPRQISQNR